MTERVVPNDVGAEAVTLGSMIQGGPEAVQAARAVADGGDFYRPAHKTLWDAVCGLADAGEPVDLVTLKHALEASGDLERIGGMDYCCAVVGGVPSAANVGYYAKIVRDKARLREIIRAAGQMAEAAYDPTADADAVVAAAEQRVYDLARPAAGGGTVTAGEAAAAVLERAERVSRGQEPAGLSLGWPILDNITGGGLRPGQLVVVAAATSIGKTSLGLRFALNVAARARAVRFFSAEMSADEIALRLLSMVTRINGLKIAPGRLAVHEWTAVREAQAALGKMDLEITEKPMPMPAMGSELRRQAARLGRPVDLAVIDYLQIIPAVGSDNLRERITAMSRGAKLMAKELRVPVVLLSQLSRLSQAERRLPELHDLKESSSIEQDADGVILLSRKTMDEDPVTGNCTVEARIAKWRNGLTTRWGELPLRFIRETADFHLGQDVEAST